MREIETVRIREVGFLNANDHESTLGLLAQAALPSGVSSAAVTALVRLASQAHGIAVHDMSTDYLNTHLYELKGLKLIHWTGGDTLKLV